MNNTHLNWLIAILLCTNASISSLVNAKSKERARKKITVNTIHLSNPITVTKNNLAAVLQKTHLNSDLLTDLALNDSVISLVTKKNFVDVATTAPGCLFLYILMIINPNIALHFTSLATKTLEIINPYSVTKSNNLVGIAKTRYGRLFLSNLMKNNPNAAIHFTSSFTKKNISELALLNRDFLSDLMKNNPNAAIHFTSLFTEKNISELALLNRDFPSDLMKNNPNAVLHFTNLVTKDNFDDLVELATMNGLFLYKLMENNPDAALHFTNLVTEKNFLRLARLNNQYHYVAPFLRTLYVAPFPCTLMENNPDALSHFASLVTAKDCIYLVKTEFGRRVLKEKARTTIIPH